MSNITSEKEKEIKKEIKRLKKIFADLDENKLKTVETLIDRAAFLTVNIRELEEQLNAEGWTEEYKNGQNQSGIKKSSAADVHISLTKNLNSIMKQLIELTPPARKKGSRLEGLMAE